MKTNTLNTLQFVSFFSTSLAISIVLVIISAMATARAQNTRPLLNQSVLNGLHSPTGAERFFEQRRRKMETEIEILTHRDRYFREPILQIETIEIKIIEETDETKPIDNFPIDSP